jgi:hypothetical protein
LLLLSWLIAVLATWMYWFSPLGTQLALAPTCCFG